MLSVFVSKRLDIPLAQYFVLKLIIPHVQSSTTHLLGFYDKFLQSASGPIMCNLDNRDHTGSLKLGRLCFLKFQFSGPSECDVLNGWIPEESTGKTRVIASSTWLRTMMVSDLMGFGNSVNMLTIGLQNRLSDKPTWLGLVDNTISHGPIVLCCLISGFLDFLVRCVWSALQ